MPPSADLAREERSTDSSIRNASQPRRAPTGPKAGNLIAACRRGTNTVSEAHRATAGSRPPRATPGLLVQQTPACGNGERPPATSGPPLFNARDVAAFRTNTNRLTAREHCHVPGRGLRQAAAGRAYRGPAVHASRGPGGRKPGGQPVTQPEGQLVTHPGGQTVTHPAGQPVASKVPPMIPRSSGEAGGLRRSDLCASALQVGATSAPVLSKS